MTADNPLRADLQNAIKELNALYQQAVVGGKLDGWHVSARTNELVPFQRDYSARLTAARAIGNELDLRGQLIADLKHFLHVVTALYDAVVATGATTTKALNPAETAQRYNARGGALQAFLQALNSPVAPIDAGVRADQVDSLLVKTFTRKSEREIFQVVARVVPSEQQVDEDITSLLYSLALSAHREPAVHSLLTVENDLRLDDDRLRQFAASQELRDVVGPYLAALIKKALDDEGVEAYDDAFRNTYFSIVNRVQNYYQTWRPAVASNSETATTQQPAAATPTLAELVSEPPQPTPTPPPTPAEKPQGIQGTGLQ